MSGSGRRWMRLCVPEDTYWAVIAKENIPKESPILLENYTPFFKKPVRVVTYCSQSDSYCTLTIRFEIKMQSFVCHERVWDTGCRAPFTLQSGIFYSELLVSLSIPINQPTKCNNFSSLLLDVYVRLNMFRASSRPSSGAQQLQ